MNALIDVKNPALVLETPAGGAGGTNPSLGREEPVPVAVSVAGGVARPRLYAVGTNPGPGIDVHEISVEQLTASLNAIRTHTIAEAGEVTAFTTMLAAMFEEGRAAGLAEAGVA